VVTDKKKATSDEECSSAFADEVFRDLLQRRKILLKGTINGSIIEKAVMQIELFNLEDDDKEQTLADYDRLQHPIMVYLHSAGGYCNEGLALISAIEQSLTPVYTVVVGKALSMGLMILTAGHYRAAYRHAELMYHQISYGALGDHTDIGRSVAYSATIQQKLEALLLERTYITKKQLQGVNDKRIDWYFTPEEALELGVIDKIIGRGLQVKKSPRPKGAKGSNTSPR
jgi:ATP-dependent Clp protease protease subunit